MHYSSFKLTYMVKWVVFVLLFCFWINTTSNINAATIADWGDVVDVHYKRYETADYSTPPVEDQPINSVYLTTGSTVPANILALFPDANAGLVLTFKEGIVGATVNVEKQFTAVNAYGDGVDLYFRVTVLEILYDASGGDSETTTTSTTTTTTTNNPFDDVGNIIIFGGGGTIIAGGLLSWAIVSSRRRGRALSSESSSASRRERSIKESKTKLKELRELAESRISDGSKTESEDSTDIKFRRRR